MSVPGQTRKSDRYISISKCLFIQKLQQTFTNDDEKQLFLQLCYSLESLLYVKHIEQMNDMKLSYSYFEPRNRLPREQLELIPLEELESKQDILLQNIFRVLNEAHFEPINLNHYYYALKSVFLSDLPIQIDFAKLDFTMLAKFYEKFPSFNPYKDDDKSTPPFYKHFILFYRGIGKYHTSGLFLDHKINILSNDLYSILKYYIIYGFNMMTARIFSDHKPIQKPTEPNTPSNESDKYQTERISLLDTYYKAKVDGFMSIVQWFLQKIELREPTFSRLVIVYRSLPEDMFHETFRKAKDFSKKYGKKLSSKMKTGLKRIESKLHGENETNMNDIHENENDHEFEEDVFDEQLDTQEVNEHIQNNNINHNNDNNTNNNQEKSSSKEKITNEFGRRHSSEITNPPLKTIVKDPKKIYNQPIHIQYFDEIPVSDIEICFPCKRLMLKTFDRLYLATIIILGLYGIIHELFTSESSFVMSVVVFGLTLLMIRGITWYKSKEDAYHNALTQTLFDSNISSDREVLLSLMDTVNEQSLMEIILAYFVIYKNDRVLSAQSLDELCENAIKQVFDSNINVRFTNILQKLQSVQLINDSITEEITVKNLQQSIDVIDNQWTAISRKASPSFNRQNVGRN